MTNIRALAGALNYPQFDDEEARNFTFFVDGLAVDAAEQADGVLLTFDLQCSEELIADFAQFSLGRMLREEAVLAWDAQRQVMFLWLMLPAGAENGQLVQRFERFVDSCEWWQARCAEKEVPQSVFPDVLIRP